jgi:protocatechuate 3,4-dioxygenase beta subunit
MQIRRVLFLYILTITLFISHTFAGLPKCYGVSDESNKMWFMVPNPGASTLPSSKEIQLAQVYKAEGSAYRASTKQMYLFDCDGDNSGPCHLHEYTIDYAQGTSSYTNVKSNIVPDNGDGSVEGATFYIDAQSGEEYLYATVGESGSKLYKWRTSDWSLVSGYPLSLSGDISTITGIAYDPISKKFYGSKDYSSSSKGSNNSDIFEINMQTGVTTFIKEVQHPVDAEGLTYAADGLLYNENDSGRYDGSRTIYTVNLANGEMVEAATFSGNDDAESLACNAGERSDFGDAPSSYGYAVHSIPVFDITPHPLYLGDNPGDDDQNYATQATMGANADGSDEDGVTLLGNSLQNSSLSLGQTYHFTIATNGTTAGYLNGWIDFNADGDFDDAGEQIATNVSPSTGGIDLEVSIPSSAQQGITYARFRYSTQQNLPPSDNLLLAEEALDGEVEDYQISITNTASISGKVVDNLNNPLANATISLYLADGTTLAKDNSGNTLPTITTDASGTFTFTNISEGEYLIKEVNPTNYTSLQDDAGNDNSANSDTNDDTIPVSLSSGESDSDNIFKDKPFSGEALGSVKDANNLPLANVNISIMIGTAVADDIQGNPLTTTTDALGNYHFVDIPVGDYLIVENDPTNYSSLHDEDSSSDGDTNANTNTNDNAIPLTITNQKVDKNNNFIDIAPSGTISGKVSDNLNAPLSSIMIEIVDSSATRIKSVKGTPLTTQSATDGTYHFSDVPLGDYFIIEHDLTGYISISDSDSSDDADNQTNSNTNDNKIPVTITTNEHDADNNFVDQKAAGLISGKVEDSSAKPIAGAKIKLIKSDNTPALDTYGTETSIITTDSSGTFSFANIPTGDYLLLEVDATGYVSISDHGGDDNSINSNNNDGIIPVTLTTGESDSDNIFVDQKEAGTISGSVKDNKANALENITITIQDNQGNTILDTKGNPLVTTTDTNGYYSFNDVPTGEFLIVEEDRSGYISISDGDSSADGDNSANTDTNDNKIPVTMTHAKDYKDNNFVDAGVYHISGRVLLDINGDEIADQKLANVTINLYSCDNNTFQDTTTDSEGNFQFDNLIAGCYTLSEEDPSGYLSVKDSDGANDNNISIMISDSDSNGHFFMDEPSVNLSGKVMADMNFNQVADTPLENVTIALYDNQNTLLARTTTDTQGSYQFTNLTPGSYTVKEIDLEGYSSLGDVDGGDKNSIEVIISTTDITDQNFQDQKQITVSGVVKVDIDGDNIVDEPLKNSTLLICKVVDPCTMDNHIDSVTTDENGTYKFVGLTPGDYQIVEVDREGYESLRDSDGANDNKIIVNLDGLGDITGQDFDNQAVAPQFVVITKTVAKKQTSIGEFVPYSITIENINDRYSYAALSIRDMIPEGFKYEKNSAKLIRGTSKSSLEPTGKERLIFGPFSLAAHEKVTLTYLLKVGVSVAKGIHTNRAIALQNSTEVSNMATASVRVISDPFSDNAVIIGKVFDDQNENGIQDKGERGIPGIRLATATGMLIETDGYGRYHIADADSGGFGARGKNYIMKVDQTTLPIGATFTTENPRVHRVTASGLNEINFGIKLPKVEKFSKEKKIIKIRIKKEIIEVEKEVKLGSIYFDSDQDCIRPDQVKTLCAIADKIKTYKHGAIKIEGNTDARAPVWYNKKLAYKRAQSVYRELRHQLGDKLIKEVDVIYDNCEREVTFDPRYDWWGKPNAPRSKKECTEFGISKKDCHTLLKKKQGGVL